MFSSFLLLLQIGKHLDDLSLVLSRREPCQSIQIYHLGYRSYCITYFRNYLWWDSQDIKTSFCTAWKSSSRITFFKEPNYMSNSRDVAVGGEDIVIRSIYCFRISGRSWKKDVLCIWMEFLLKDGISSFYTYHNGSAWSLRYSWRMKESNMLATKLDFKLELVGQWLEPHLLPS